MSCAWALKGSAVVLQEFLIEELAKRAFDITAKSNRDIISYIDVGECMMHSTILLLILLSSTACCIFAILMLASFLQRRQCQSGLRQCSSWVRPVLHLVSPAPSITRITRYYHKECSAMYLPLPSLQPPWLCGLCLLVEQVIREVVELELANTSTSITKIQYLVTDIVPKRIPLSELIKRLREAQGGQNGMFPHTPSHEHIRIKQSATS